MSLPAMTNPATNSDGAPLDRPHVNLFVGDAPAVAAAADLPRNRYRRRVGLNLLPLALRGGGMRQYVMQLLPLLVRRTDHEFLFFHGLSARASVGAILRDLTADERLRVRLVDVDHPSEIYGHASSFDVYFCPLNGFEPQLLDRPTLATLADVQERFFPQYFSAGELHSRGIVYPRVIHSVTSLITISEFSKETICSEFDADPGRVHVTHLAPNYGMLNAASEWPDSLPPLPGRYVVYPANTYPHKNHALLIEAMGRLKAEGRLTFSCVLTGHHVDGPERLDSLIAEHGLADDAVWLGHVPPGALRHLYEKAIALCFPSEFEGFGMPLVEAMYCGCPVVANRAASIPEICGDAAIYVPPQADSWAESLASLVDDRAALADLTERGRRQAQRFTVESLADETIALIDGAVETFRGPEDPAARMSFVVLAGHCNRSLEHTLKNLALVVGESDQVLVVGGSGPFDDRVRLLIDNFEQVEIVEKDCDWTSQVTADFAMVMGAGATIVEGGPKAACAALEANPSQRLAIGEVLYDDPQGNYVGLSYTRFHEGILPPLEAVVWRRDELIRHKGHLAKTHPVDAVLKDVPRQTVLHLSRTIAARIVWHGLGRPRRSLPRRLYLRFRRAVATRVRKHLGFAIRKSTA